MSDRRQALLLAAMRRAGKPVSSDTLLDEAAGLALANGWPVGQVSSLNRKAVAQRLRMLVEAGQARECGTTVDVAARRATPLYEPTAGYDARAAAPPPPAADPASVPPREASPYEGRSRQQLLALLDVQDSLLDCLRRFLVDLDAEREKSRARLLAEGLGGRP